ncbi:MAG TPA: VacJ family lipoprotein [Hyphomonadaceae bacterium]|nr:VacJ family lipoprotein [Hyphomonadaceae bacterium]
MRYFLTALGLAAAGILSPGTALAQEEIVSDPWEGANRNLYAVHDAIDEAVLEPVARGYRAITPRIFRIGLSNVLRNLRAPVTFANDVLQGESERAGVTAARFGLNTTLGLGGLMDPATDLGFELHDEDFGQTLGAWGVEAGPYVFVPLMGPTTVRDAAGRIVDIAFDPLSWADIENADAVRGVRTGAAAVSSRESLIESVEDLRENSFDPYVSVRTTYTLLRQSAVRNSEERVEDLPDFGDMPGMPDMPDDAAPTPAPEAAPAPVPPQEPAPPPAQTSAAPSSSTSPGELQ